MFKGLVKRSSGQMETVVTTFGVRASGSGFRESVVWFRVLWISGSRWSDESGEGMEVSRKVDCTPKDEIASRKPQSKAQQTASLPRDEIARLPPFQLWGRVLDRPKKQNVEHWELR